jgi:hypothetical protein
MNKKIILIFAICSIHILSEQNLLIFSGCENEKNIGTIHTPLLYALVFKNDPILVSGSILQYLLTENCTNNICENKLTEDDILERFTTYYYDSFFLFIPKNNKDYEAIFNIKKIKPINLETEPDKQFAQKIKCSLENNPPYITQSLLSDILNKTQEELNIYLVGHGEFVFEKNKSNFLSNLNDLNLNLTSLDLDQLKNLKEDIFLKNTQEILRKYNLDIKSFLVNNDLDDLNKYISSQIQFLENINNYLEESYSYIAGIPIAEFIQILNLLNGDINTNLLYITSCFSGGLNSVLPFFNNKINLQQKTYNFDIISISTSESTYENLYKENAGIVIKENSLDLFYELNKNLSFQQAYNNIISKYEQGALIDPNRLALPILRKKNSNNWFPILPLFKSPKFTFYSITKTLNNVYEAENRDFILNFPSASLISTRCITAPIKTHYKNKLIIRNLLNLYIKEMIFEKLTQNNLKEIFARIGKYQAEFGNDFEHISVLDGLYKTFPVIPEEGIFIEKLKIEDTEINNLKIYEVNNKISLEIEYKNNTLLISANKDQYQNLTDFDIYYLTKQNWFKNEKEMILKNCPKIDLKSLIKVLKK